MRFRPRARDIRLFVLLSLLVGVSAYGGHRFDNHPREGWVLIELEQCATERKFRNPRTECLVTVQLHDLDTQSFTEQIMLLMPRMQYDRMKSFNRRPVAMVLGREMEGVEPFTDVRVRRLKRIRGLDYDRSWTDD